MRGANALRAVLDRLDANADGSLSRMIEVLRIPSVSTDPAFVGDCTRAAEWFRDQLHELGFAATSHSTAGHPVVMGHRKGPAEAPHVLFYAHYDVQPPDPVALWNTDPFDPQVIEGPRGRQVVGRGTADDKGQSLCWLEAIRAWIEATGGLPVGATVIVEGEEEIGSPSLPLFLEKQRDALRADVAIVSDTPMWDADTPAVVTRLRGAVMAEIVMRGADRDLHSGLYGGSALNPIQALSRVLTALHDDEGRVTLPGFYDGVRELEPEQARELDRLGFDEGAFLREVGLSAPAGEAGRGALERLWHLPTAEITGIRGGYAGHGFKAVIAAEAVAKLSLRLVPGQDPDAVFARLERFVRERTPAAARVEVRAGARFPAYALDIGTRWLDYAHAAMAPDFTGMPATIGVGGGLPVVELFRRILKLDTLLMGFGLPDDNLHGPNEKFDLDCFNKGARSHVRLLAKLAEETREPATRRRPVAS